MLPVRLVIVRTIIIKVPFIVLFLLFTLPSLAVVFYSATCISATDDIMQVAVVSVTSSAVLLLWSDATGRIPMKTLLLVIIMTPVSILLVTD
jgi:hypothetical protein